MDGFDRDGEIYLFRNFRFVAKIFASTKKFALTLGASWTGRSCRGLPSKKIFSNIEFSLSILERRLKELAYLNKGLKIELKDMRKDKTKNLIFKFDGGINEFVQDLNKSKSKIKNEDNVSVLDEPLYYYSTKNDINVECALLWNNSYNENVLCFTTCMLSLCSCSSQARPRGALERQRHLRSFVRSQAFVRSFVCERSLIGL